MNTMDNDASKFIEGEDLNMKSPIEGYLITYSQLCDLLNRYHQSKVNNSVLDDVIISTTCPFCQTIQDYNKEKVETCGSCKKRGY